MPSLRQWLMPPGPDSDPRDSLRWVRRSEVIGGVGALAFGLALWNAGWWHWVLIASGVLGLSPWPGAVMILRRSERNPRVLVSDPDRRRARARSAGMIQIPIYVVVGLVIGYLSGGWGAAIFAGLLGGASAGLGMWWWLRTNNA